MSVVKKSISVTDQQDQWIKQQIEAGYFGNESEVVRDLIRDRINREEEIKAIRSALIKGEQSGVSSKTADQIWFEAEERHRTQNA